MASARAQSGGARVRRRLRRREARAGRIDAVVTLVARVAQNDAAEGVEDGVFFIARAAGSPLGSTTPAAFRSPPSVVRRVARGVHGAEAVGAAGGEPTLGDARRRGRQRGERGVAVRDDGDARGRVRNRRG